MNDKDLKKLIKEHLKKQHIMQLATVRGGKPWSCTVYYVPDDELSLYWASWPTRRHSLDIQNCDTVAISIPVQFGRDQESIGIQAEGTAEILQNPEAIRPIARKYAQEFGRDAKWIDDFTLLKTRHRLYKFTPEKYLLFDEENFPANTQKELQINE